MKSKALFAIKEVKSDGILSEPMFDNKQLAKEHRRKLNPKTKEGDEVLDYVVTYGPDHDKFDAETAFIKTVRKNKDVTPKEVEQTA